MQTRGSDDLDTPARALSPVLPYLPHRIWECAPGRWHLVRAMEAAGHYVLAYENHDFLRDVPPHEDFYDAIVTNPPFSKKASFLARCVEIGKPWALLLPVTTLGVASCQRNLHGAEFIFLPRRIDFTGEGAPWFAVCWITSGLKIGQPITFSQASGDDGYQMESR